GGMILMNQKNYNLMSRYVKWKKDNALKEWVTVLSFLVIALSVVLLEVSNFLPEVLIISFLFGFIILLNTYDEYLKNWYTSFNEDEIKKIAFFKKNGFLK